LTLPVIWILASTLWNAIPANYQLGSSKHSKLTGLVAHITHITIFGSLWTRTYLSTLCNVVADMAGTGKPLWKARGRRRWYHVCISKYIPSCKSHLLFS
jgi:hypothetical protein